MLSDAERDLHKRRATHENTMFAHLDQFFDDPSDENLATLQDLRREHRELIQTIGREYTKRRDAEKASVSPSLKPIAAAEIERRMDELRKNAEARIDALSAEIKAKTEKEEAQKPRSFWDRIFG